MIDWAWAIDHLDELAGRTIQHLVLTSIAVLIGFAISLALSIWAVRRKTVRTVLVTASGVLYTIPSLALFAALVPITGLSILTAVIPLILYTLLIYMRNILAGLDAVPTDVLEAADAMGYTPRARLTRVELPLALPLIIGGLGFFIFDRPSFTTEILFGASPSIALAIVVDLVLQALGRRLSPWARTMDTPKAIDPGVSMPASGPA